MRIKNIACIATLLLASFSAAQASTLLSRWTFDNLATGPNLSPAPSGGVGTASAVGMANSYNNTNSLSDPTIISLAGSSSGLPNCWQISGGGAAPNGGDGWSTQAPIGSQGAQFAAGTAGFYRIMVSFDVYATADAEANLQVQYTTEGTIWYNATNITSGGTAVIANNSASTNTVSGTYVVLRSGWNNQITVDLSGISGVDNNPNFAVRLVNASTGADCVDTTGAVYNNASGSWTVDNVAIQGVSIDTVSDWTFASYGAGGIYASNSAYVENPIPEINFGNPSLAACIGFDVTNFDFGSGVNYSTNAPDVLVQAGSSTPNNTYCWRMRGAPGNGWTSEEPIGTQGAEFDVSTLNYTNVIVTFDLYFTSQAEAKMCVLYTTNGWTNSFTANNLAFPSNPQLIQTNDPDLFPGTYSPYTVTGTFFYNNIGQNWFNDMVVDFTGIPNVANNPNFGIRIVNAATGSDDVNYTGAGYNNSSGNSRLGNVNVGGQFNGLTPPAVTGSQNATVDSPFTNTFTDNPDWRTNISAIYLNGVILTNSAYSTAVPGQIVFIPANSTLLQAAGLDSIVVFTPGYSTVRVTQPVAAGAFQNLNINIQPLGPSASGGTLEVNPVLSLTDQYGNTTTNPYANVVVTAAAGGSGGWTLGGATVQPEINGLIAFTNLSATVNGSSAVSGAAIALTVTGYTNAANHTTTTNFNLSTFTIGAPPAHFTPGNLTVFQVDTLSNNTTFSMIEVKPSTVSQTTPANIVPISATGTNALRMSPAGTTGRLCLSQDGTLLCFAAFEDGSAATPDETFNLDRAAVGMNYTNLVTIGATYTSTSLGGSQARAAATLDDVNYFIDDKGGLYYGSGFLGQNANVDGYNNVVVKTFGPPAAGLASGAPAGPLPYVETQKAVTGAQIPVVYYAYNAGSWFVEPNNLSTDPNATDFYLISTNGGVSFDVMYTCDQVSSKQGVINKYSWIAGADPFNPNGTYGWAVNGSWTNGNGVDGLFVTTNGAGDAYIYYTTGAGGTAGNQIVRLTDASGWDQPINIISSNLIYTAAKTVSIKGLTFTPQQIANTNEPIPTPLLVAQSYVATNGFVSFSITNTPDDAGWRANITAITVNGSVLPPAAYDTTQTGVIVFNPSQSALLQSAGTKVIGFTATGYSSNSISQLLTGNASKLVVTTQPAGPLGDGGVLKTSPVVTVEDAGGNAVLTATPSITAQVATNGTWIIGGTTARSASSGVAPFTGLTAASIGLWTNANISFTATGLTAAVSKVFTIPAPVRPTLRGSAFDGSNGSFTFTFTNATGLTFSVLATNNVAAPLSTWPVVGSAVESPAGSGSYSFTNAPGTNSQLFYILEQQGL